MYQEYLNRRIPPYFSKKEFARAKRLRKWWTLSSSPDALLRGARRFENRIREPRNSSRSAGRKNEGEKSPADFRGQGYGASGCLMFLSHERTRESEDFRFRKLRATYQQTFFSSCFSMKRCLGPVVLDFRTVAPGESLTTSDIRRDR